jgi:hypothetical protein
MWLMHSATVERALVCVPVLVLILCTVHYILYCNINRGTVRTVLYEYHIVQQVQYSTITVSGA